MMIMILRKVKCNRKSQEKKSYKVDAYILQHDYT